MDHHGPCMCFFAGRKKLFDNTLMKDAVRLANEHRKYLHTVPEKAFEEHKTTAYIKKVCAGYPVREIYLGMETGAVYWLDAGCDETVALRADIDAVPTQDGPHHYCGHDAHTASLLGAMHYLCELVLAGQKLPFNVLFIFQPAEEGTKGAMALIGHGLFEKVPQRPLRIFGIHNRPEVECGDIVVHKGPLMSEKSVFSVAYTGIAGHGSLPHKCVDPIVAAASLVSGIQTIASRNVDPFKPVICTVNSIRAGDPDIAVPSEAVVTGYIRSFDHDTHKRMEERLRRLAGSTAEAYECKCSTKITRMVPAVDNPEELYDIARIAAETAAGIEHVTDSAPSLASEDFAVYGTEIPAFFYWVGSGTPGKENAPWHDPAFCIDTHYLETAVPLLCAAAMTD